jgi:hypothetical protein
MILGIIALPVGPLLWFLVSLNIDRHINGISWLFVFLTGGSGLVALILAIAMLVQQKKRRRGGAGMAITGIVLGSIGVLLAITGAVLSITYNASRHYYY